MDKNRQCKDTKQPLFCGKMYVCKYLFSYTKGGPLSQEMRWGMGDTERCVYLLSG